MVLVSCGVVIEIRGYSKVWATSSRPSANRVETVIKRQLQSRVLIFSEVAVAARGQHPSSSVMPRWCGYGLRIWGCMRLELHVDILV
jgi:hypothetical protein